MTTSSEHFAESAPQAGSPVLPAAAVVLAVLGVMGFAGFAPPLGAQGAGTGGDTIRPPAELTRPGRGTFRHRASPSDWVIIPGEVLHYEGDFGVFGKVGEGRMAVSGPECRSGQEVHRIDFEFGGRIMLRSVRDETTSWIVLDGRDFHTLEYRKDERHPMGGHQEHVRVFPEESRWESKDGAGGELRTDQPLDELSFLYLVRGLDLEPGESVELDRHFDPARSPVVVRARGSGSTTVPAGEFQVRVLEMEVRDRERFGGTERVVLHVTDDEHRIPVRIESSMPVAGTMRLVLTGRTQEGAGTNENTSSDAVARRVAAAGGSSYEGSLRCDI